MTTAVTVDAHAGWPVKVSKEQKNAASGEWEAAGEETVAANTQRTIHIHSSMRVTCEELRKDATD